MKEPKCVEEPVFLIEAESRLPSGVFYDVIDLDPDFNRGYIAAPYFVKDCCSGPEPISRIRKHTKVRIVHLNDRAR
jgi:hypothetical protein